MTSNGEARTIVYAGESPRFVEMDEIAGIRDRHASTRLKMAGLWVTGSLHGLSRTTIAIIGSRSPSEAGRKMAMRFAGELTDAGCCVLTGLALGIDAAAHEGALDAGAPSIGVLGGGHNQFFPPRNMPLAERMVSQGGAVVSPYPPESVPRPFQFLQRNAVVAGLADAVLVIEASSRSGALSTSSWAQDFGVPVLAIPGDVDRPRAAGCNALIRDGATLVRNSDDVLTAIGLSPLLAHKSHATTLIDALPYAAPIVTKLREAVCDIEHLAVAIDAPVGVILGTLLRLELLGVVARAGSEYQLAPSVKIGS